MLPWALREFLPAGKAEGIVSTWRAIVGEKVWRVFSIRWREMRNLNQGQWPPSWTKELRGYPGIYEMRVKVSRYQYRPLFIFGPSRGEITFVFMAEEVGDEFVPKDAPDRAQRIRQDVISGRSRTDELDIDK